MYSVVLMMALSGGAESADFGHRRASDCNGCSGCSGAVASCHGCTGSSCSGSCTGTVVVSCSGSSCNGCHGSSACNGCDGGGRQGLFGRLFHRNRGSDCCSAPVACHGCTGSHGCNGCSGTVIYQGCSGCTGVVTHGCTGCAGSVVVPNTTTTPPPVKKMPTEKVPPPTKKEKIEEVSAPATIVVTLPADAALTVDGKATTSTSERRTFITPNLDQASDYVYTLRAEVVRDGRSVIETQQITVRGGQTTNVPFVFSSQGIASR